MSSRPHVTEMALCLLWPHPSRPHLKGCSGASGLGQPHERRERLRVGDERAAQVEMGKRSPLSTFSACSMLRSATPGRSNFNASRTCLLRRATLNARGVVECAMTSESSSGKLSNRLARGESMSTQSARW